MVDGSQNHASASSNVTPSRAASTPVQNQEQEQNCEITGTATRPPVQLLACVEDPQLFDLHVHVTEQVGFLFRLCELLLKHTMNVQSAHIAPEDGSWMHVHLLLRKPGIPAKDCAAVVRLGQDLDRFVQRCETTEPPRPEDPTTLERLSVNPDLLSVSLFREIPGDSEELSYELELEGINQAGLIAYLSLVLFRSRFSIVNLEVNAMPNGVGLLNFKLSAKSTDAHQRLSTYLDLPYTGTRRGARVNGCSFDKVPSGASGVDNGDIRSRFSSDNSVDLNRCSLASILTSGGDNDGISLDPEVCNEPEVQWRQYALGDDIYEGGCVQGPEGLKQHGFGTYWYRAQAHRSYKQYKGQWSSGKKHGHGVLLLKSGGVYVGQFVNNKKHGFGVYFDVNVTEEGCSGSTMPTYSYEGEWVEDEKSGYGVEDTDDSQSVFFGSFFKDQRFGRGIQVDFDKDWRVKGCEAQFRAEGCDNQCWRPLLEELEMEMERLQALKSQSESVGRSMPVTYSAASMEVVAAKPEKHMGCGARSAPCIDLGIAPVSPKSTQWMASPCEHRSQNATQWMSSPRKNVPSNLLMHSPISPQWMSSPKARQSPHGRPQQFASPVSKLAPLSPSSSPRLKVNVPAATTDDIDDQLEFVLVEESGFELPVSTRLTQPEAEPSPQPELEPLPRVDTSSSASQRAESNDQEIQVATALPPNQTLPASPRTATAALGRDANWTTENSKTRNRPMLGPMLWSKVELSAFLSVLGLDEAARLVRQHKLNGVQHFVHMSDKEMRQELGLTRYAERRLMRRALKRFLELDRLENRVSGTRLTDAVDDPVLRDFLVPPEELHLVKKISEGGFGDVHRGILKPQVCRGKLERNRQYPVAVKEMKGDRSMRVHELLKEGRIMASLHHPNMCKFVGICVESRARGGKQFILSELMDCSLFDLVHCSRKLNVLPPDLRASMSLSEGICAGIGYLHSMKLVHADLKSPNILIDASSGEKFLAKICDFGHAAVRAHPAPHHRCGTPHWAAPEALRCEALGPEADVFSCGVILWEMLAQNLPHQDLTYSQVVGAVGWNGWTPDMDLLLDVPTKVKELLQSCFNFNPAARPSPVTVQTRLCRLRRRSESDAIHMLDGFLDAQGSRESSSWTCLCMR